MSLCLASLGCQLKRPETTPTRMLEPQLLEPQLPAPERTGTGASGEVAVRLLDTQARGHIGRRLLHHQPSGELVEDPMWRWSSAPDRYLDTALRLALASSSELRLVDAANAPTLAATLLAWQLESEGGTRLAGAVELQFTGSDRVVRTRIMQASEPVSGELPGDLAAAAGRLLRRLAVDGLGTVSHEQ